MPLVSTFASASAGAYRGKSAGGFTGGDIAAASIYAACQLIATGSDSSGPQAGGTLTINGEALGSYDYVIKEGSITLGAGSPFSNGDFFTTTQDSRGALVVVKGNLTIDAGQTFIPSHRKLFLAIYVTGTLTINGAISMTGRGANHSAAAGNVTAAAIRWATGTFSSVTNPQVPAAGANGAAGKVQSGVGNAAGNAGSDSDGAGSCGGGASGAASSSGNTSTSGAGAAGTSFGGGPASGGVRTTSGNLTSPDAGTNGSAGGAANSNQGTIKSGGGAGNPGGAGSQGGDNGASGTGGVLGIFCGTLAGSGSIVAQGAAGGSATAASGAGTGGGGSGGGSITAFYGTDSSSITPNANGGAGGTGDGANGGRGGHGTARKLALAA